MVSNTAEVKQFNKERILQSVQKRDHFTKAEISRETALSVATCSTILNEMLEAGEIVKINQEDALIGRPATLFSYNKDYQHVLGVGLSIEGAAYKLHCVVADALGAILLEDITYEEQADCDMLIHRIAPFLEKDDKIQAIGIAIPGVAQNGLVDYCDIKEMEQVNLQKAVQDALHVHVVIGNDINLITYAIACRQDDFSHNLATVFFPEHAVVGCGFMVNGHILKGDTMLSGELSFAARAFGISKEEQKRMGADRTKLLPFVAQLLLMIICTINPAKIVLMGHSLREADIAAITMHCLKIVDRKHIPEISVDNHVTENYIGGLLHFTLDNMQYRISRGHISV